jgi:SAM-dependent methyltransferase
MQARGRSRGIAPKRLPRPGFSLPVQESDVFHQPEAGNILSATPNNTEKHLTITCPMRTRSFDSQSTGMLDKLIWQMRASQVRKYLSRTVETVADFGCGRSAPLLHTLLVNGTARKATGVDLDPDFSTETNTLTLLKADLNKPLPLRNSSFDAALSLATLEHLDEPDLHLREIHRTLKPNGILLLTTPSPRGKPVLEFLAYRLKIIDQREIEDHRQYFNSAMLESALERAGFIPATINARTFQLGMNNIVVAFK